jgi:excisionase family DNA binding protein
MTELTISPDQVQRIPLKDSDELPEWAASLLELVSEAARAGETVEIHTRVQTMTPSEVAKRLGLSTSTVSRRIKAGEIRTIKVGNRHRIPVPEYDAFRRSLLGRMAEHYAGDIEDDLIG